MLYRIDPSLCVFPQITWRYISLSGTWSPIHRSTGPFSYGPYLVPNICIPHSCSMQRAVPMRPTPTSAHSARFSSISSIITCHGFPSSTAVGVCPSAPYQPSAGCIQTTAPCVYAVRYAARRAFIGPTPPMAGPSCCLAHASAFLSPRSIIRAYPRAQPAVFPPTSAWTRCHISFLTHRVHL